MSDSGSPSGMVVNLAVLAILALAIGALIDYAAAWMGFAPPVGCALLPFVQTLSATAGIVLVFVGVVLLCFVSNKVPGVTLILGGLFVGVLPEVFNAYLVRIAGIGCAGP